VDVGFMMPGSIFCGACWPPIIFVAEPAHVESFLETTFVQRTFKFLRQFFFSSAKKMKALPAA
jgi:hypothetical protein